MYRSGQWIETPDGIEQKTLEKGVYNGQKSQIYMFLPLLNILQLIKNILQKRYLSVAQVLAGEAKEKCCYQCSIVSK